MLLYLYDKYSKKEGKSLSLLHGKALLLVPIAGYFILSFYMIEKLLNVDINNFFFSGKFSIANIFFCIIIYLFISKITYTTKTIDLMPHQITEIQKGKKNFWIFYIGSIVLFVIIALIKKWFFN
jgi:hypothetical protein